MNKYAIIVNKDADKCILHMADKLKEYLLRITSFDIPILSKVIGYKCFSLGQTTVVPKIFYDEYLQKTEGDGFAICEYDGNVVFVSRSSRGIAYAVYDYLERFYGVRFLTSECEYVPINNCVIIPKENIISNPSFQMRTYLTADIFQQRADKEFLLKSRTNDVFTRVSEEFGGANNVYVRGDNHNFHLFVPFEVYGNEYPEFYRFVYVNGQIYPTIDLTNGITEEGTLDETVDVSVAKIVIDEMKRDIISHPECSIFNFTQEDGPYYYDDDNNRRLESKYKRSGILIRFCNVLVRELNKFCLKELNGRQIKIITFAYGYVREAPVKYIDGKAVPLDESVIADENLIFQLAVFSNCAYDYFDDRQSEGVKKVFTEWPIIAKNFWFWGYDCDFRRYLNFFNSFPTIKKTVAGVKKMGVTYLCINGPYESHTNWQANIRAYIFRKLMWDLSLSQEELQNEFINIFYGPSANTVKKVIELFDNNFNSLIKNGVDIRFIVRGSGSEPANISIKLLNDSIQLLKDELSKLQTSNIKDKDIYIKRLKRVLCTPEFFIYDNYRFYFPDESDEIYIKYRDYIFELADSCGIDYVGERWTMEQYKTEWQFGLKNYKKEDSDKNCYVV